MFGTTFKTLHIFNYIYKLFGYKCPLKYVHVSLESPSMCVCVMIFFFFAFVFLSSGLLDLGSFTSIAGGTTTSTCLECGGNRHRCHPSTKLDPPFLSDGRRCTVWIVFFVDFYGKCRWIYHTWILWVRIPVIKGQPPWFFQKSVRVGILKKAAPKCLMIYMKDVWKDDATKTNTRGIDAAQGFLVCLNFFDDTANQIHKVAGRS